MLSVSKSAFFLLSKHRTNSAVTFQYYTNTIIVSKAVLFTMFYDMHRQRFWSCGNFA